VLVDFWRRIFGLLQKHGVKINNTWSVGAGLLVSLGLVAYALSPLPGNYLAVFLIPIVLYLNLTLLYLKAQDERTKALELERAHWTKALEAERAHWTKALEAERARWTKALEAERARSTKALEAEKAERVKAFARRDSKWYQSFSRVLTPDDERLFCTVWSEALGIPIETNHLRYLQHRVSQVENLCLGRLAGTIQDAILRVLVASSIQGNSLRFLEIGTLFGVNAVLVYDIASCFFEQVKLTMIDPLDGYYGSDKVDIGSGLPVTRTVLQRNLDRLMIPSEDYEIIQEYSTSPTAVKLAGQNTYNFVLIDGDHSYEGVKADFELYSPMLETSGYLVFDDYQRKSWPEVEQFVNEVVLESPLYEYVGASWQTIVFRKK
jgi:predicted O-methyltransferase YrrM